MSEAAAFRSDGRSERESNWQVAHEQLVSLARSRAGLDFEEGRWLVAALRGGVHVQLGYGSFVEYVERLFGYGPRLTHDQAAKTSPGAHMAHDEATTSISAHAGNDPVKTDIGAHVGRDEATTIMNARMGSSQPLPRATQDVPPAVRRQVLP